MNNNVDRVCIHCNKPSVILNGSKRLQDGNYYRQYKCKSCNKVWTGEQKNADEIKPYNHLIKPKPPLINCPFCNSNRVNRNGTRTTDSMPLFFCKDCKQYYALNTAPKQVSVELHKGKSIESYKGHAEIMRRMIAQERLKF